MFFSSPCVLKDGKAADSELDGWERHIVRAIQAAQEARGGGLYFGSPSAGARPNVRRPRNGREGGSGGVRSLCGLLGTGGSGSCACWLGEPGSTASLVFGLQLAWAALESGIDVLLPLWMLLPGKLRVVASFSAELCLVTRALLYQG